MKLSEMAMNRSRFTFFVAAAVMIAGVLAYLDFPSQEEPSVPVRAAAVITYAPGMPTETIERLVARPVEEKVRSMAEVKRITTRVRTGMVLMTVEVHDSHTDMAPIWQRLRSRMMDLTGSLPAGTQGPFVDDEYGRVAVASLALSGRGLTPDELRRQAKQLRDELFRLPGVESVAFHGLPQEAIYLESKSGALEAAGLSPASLAADLQNQNIILPGGEVRLGSIAATVNPTGELKSTADLAALPVSLPQGGSVPLGSLVEIRRSPIDPPLSSVTHSGERAVILAISMREGLNIISFGDELKKHVDGLRRDLPAGVKAEFITFQADVVAKEMSATKRVFYETIAIVMGVVILFIGLRAGWIVGVTVPLTMLFSLLVMDYFAIPLNNVTLAAMIISLGLLVDNGIVLIEDVLRRLSAGEERRAACVNAGRSLAIPLLTATLACIAAFLPLMLVKNATGDYVRSLSWVMTITLLGSWFFSLLVVPLLAYHFARVKEGESHAETDEVYQTPFYQKVRKVLGFVQSHRIAYAVIMVALLSSAVFASRWIPSAFLAESNRRQVQLFWDLPPGTGSDTTAATADRLSKFIQSNAKKWNVRDEVTFIGDGGPRFVLSINPPDPVPHSGFTLINLQEEGEIDEIVSGMRTSLADAFPGVRMRLAKFSFGSFEAGTLIYRISGPDSATLRELAGRFEAALHAEPGVTHVRNDWEPEILRASVEIDQTLARAAGVTTTAVAQTLSGVLGGDAVSEFREDDRSLPILWRADAESRARAENLTSIPVSTPSGGFVPLASIARINWVSEPALIQRRNMERTISVIARHPQLSAADLQKRIAPTLDSIAIPVGYRVAIGGEIEEANEANDSIATFLPLAGLLLAGVFVWQFNSIRKVLIIALSVPFSFIGVVSAMALMGGKFDFMATLGLLALMGIIVSNAVLLLERIEEERHEGKEPREAVMSACLKRLRPIVMTKLTCILGLLPLYFFGGALWENLAVTLIGGLTVGTLITLGLVPSLYHWFFLRKSSPA